MSPHTPWVVSGGAGALELALDAVHQHVPVSYTHLTLPTKA